MIPQALISSREIQGWAGGCGRCAAGLITPPPIKGYVIDERRAQFRAGELTFCDCAAGKSYFKLLSGDGPSQDDEIAGARRAAEERRRQKIFANAGVPDQYSEFTFASYVKLTSGKPGKESAIAVIQYFYEHGYAFDRERTYPGLFLWGEPGVGKTGALSPLFMHLLRNGKSGIWISYPELMGSMRSFEDGNVDERLRELQRVDILFIDDFGDPDSQRSASDYSRDIIFRIVDYRLTHHLPMLVTSNLGPGAVVDQFHKRIARRIGEACMMVRVSGEALGSAVTIRHRGH